MKGRTLLQSGALAVPLLAAAQKVAQAIGVTFPQAVRSRADRVIE